MINIKDVKVGDLYVGNVKLQTTGNTKRVPVKVVDVQDKYIVTETIPIPAYYIMSRPYKICFAPIELNPEDKFNNLNELREFIVKSAKRDGFFGRNRAMDMIRLKAVDEVLAELGGGPKYNDKQFTLEFDY